jgi:hypothetical protein
VIRVIFLTSVLVVSVHILLFSQELTDLNFDHGNKIAPALKNGKIESVRVQVKDKSAFILLLKTQFPHVKIGEEERNNVYQIDLKKLPDIELLAQSPVVEFIDRGNRVPKEEKALGAFDLTLNKIPAAQNSFSLTGEGLAASIKEKPFDTEDIDLKNRVIINNQFDEPPTLHATSMATIIAGAGNSEPSGAGVARDAEVTTSDFLQLLPDDGNALVNMAVSVQNHSYGVGIENYYGIESAAYDNHCNEFPVMMHVFSSGNEGDKPGVGAYASIPGFANLTGQFKVSKNTVSVGSADGLGNVGGKSSRGPADDGRLKPEVVAFGDAGSSDAAAVVSGISLLVQQKYRDQVGSLPSSSLVKALLINSADDVGRSEVDFETGFGNVDALGAVRTIDMERFFIGAISGTDETVFDINVPPNAHKFKATLVWNDVAALPGAATALVNDLDLEVRHIASGMTWKPWVLSHYPHRDSLLLLPKRKADHLNNVEQVTIELPAPGDYEISVKGFSIPQGPQAFSIAYETESGFEWTNPTSGSSFTSGRSNFVRWRWSESQLTGKLEYKQIDNTEWIEISNNINLVNQSHQWVTPDSTVSVQLRMTAGSATYESDMFSIVSPMALKVGYNCDEETMLIWPDLEAADQYQLFQLGEKYLEPFLLTTDTFAILNAIDKQIFHYAIAPVMRGMIGEKGTTINYTSVGTECYFINFLPRQYVVIDEARFDLTIGTTFKLKSVIFERLSKDVPTEIERISPTGTTILLQDPSPEPGINRYRVKLEDDQMETVYVSDYEEVFYVRNQDLFVFPNPIASGELLNIVVNDLGTVRLQVYDAMGRLMEEVTDQGAIKTFNTTKLIQGAYFIEVWKTNGTRLTARLMIY